MDIITPKTQVMRAIFLTTAMTLLSSAAFAETFTFSSAVDSVTAYPDGAKVTRAVTFDIPAGQHKLLIGDVPAGFAVESLRVTGGDGLVIGALGLREDRLPPDEREIAARQVFQDQIDALRDVIRGRHNDKAADELVIDAADARITFLEALGEQATEGASVEALTQLVGLVGSETLKALQDAQAAKVRIDEINRDIGDLQDELADLRKERDAVALPLADRVIVSLDVNADEAASGVLQISYTTWAAGWAPVYDVRLDQATSEVSVERQVMLRQSTGESWDGVTMTVSTARPNLRLNPGELASQQAYLFDPILFEQGFTDNLVRSSIAPAAPMRMEQEVMADAVRAPVALSFQGMTAVYHLPGAITLEGDGAEVLFTIDTTDFDVDLTARVTPLLDDNGYLYAGLTNDSAAPYLPGTASFYRDGAYIGKSNDFPMIAAGQSVDLPFGVIDGLTTERVTMFRETGESGILTTSNDREERYELRVENATNLDWDVILYDRVPFSEEEDLEIAVTALPKPTDTSVDGKRGVYAWEFSLLAGADKTVNFSYEIDWPEGKELGFQ